MGRTSTPTRDAWARGSVDTTPVGVNHLALAAPRQHWGNVGYYDDDEGSRAVVYLGEPFRTNPLVRARRDLEKLTA